MSAGVPGQQGIWKRSLLLVWQADPQRATAVLVLGIVAGLIPAASVAATEMTVGNIASAFADPSEGATRRALLATAFLASLAIVGFVVNTVEGYLQAVLQARLAHTTNLSIVEKAVELELADFERSETYDRLQRAVQEGGTRPYRILIDGLSVLVGGVSLVATLSIVLGWNPIIGLLLVASALPNLFIESYFGRLSWDVERERTARRRWAMYLQFLATNDKNVKEVKLFGLGNLIVKRYRDTMESFLDVDRRLEGRQSRYTGLSGILSLAATGGATFIAAMSAVETGDVGRFAGILAAVAAVQGSASAVFMSIGMLYQHKLFVAELFAFLDTGLKPMSSGERHVASPLRSGFAFDAVSFAYEGQTRQVLSDVSFNVGPGEVVALVGPNGAGKTTIAKLLSRLYEPSGGRITIDDVLLAEYDLPDLRKAIGVTFQDFVQYEESAHDNIAYGNVDRMDDRLGVTDAASRSGARQTIEQLPDGFDSRLGRWFDGAQQLSTGQWQRVAIARALVGRPPIVILDEPTASIDAQAEADFFDEFRANLAGAACLLVSHRYSTVRNADRILVLDAGRIAEQGTHDDLVALGGIYASLFVLQAKGYLE